MSRSTVSKRWATRPSGSPSSSTVRTVSVGRFLGNLELRRRHDVDDLDDVGERSVRRDALVLVAGLAVRQVGRDVDLQLVARLRPE